MARRPVLLTMTKPMQAQIKALERARVILANMAEENEGAIFNRWPINHEPLRNDARNALPEIDAALTAAAQAGEQTGMGEWAKGFAHGVRAEQAMRKCLGEDCNATIERCKQVVNKRAKAFGGDGRREIEAIAAALDKLKDKRV